MLDPFPGEFILTEFLEKLGCTDVRYQRYNGVIVLEWIEPNHLNPGRKKATAHSDNELIGIVLRYYSWDLLRL